MADQAAQLSGSEGFSTSCVKCGLDLLVYNTEKGLLIIAFMGLKCTDQEGHEPWDKGVQLRIY